MQVLSPNLITTQCTSSSKSKTSLTINQFTLFPLIDPNNLENCAHSQKEYFHLNKYKTQLCKNYSQNGFCPYKSKCQFAHGYAQINNVGSMSNQKFRTKKCKSFWEQGSCSYGARCQFSHDHSISIQTMHYLQIWKISLGGDLRSKNSRIAKILQDKI